MSPHAEGANAVAQAYRAALQRRSGERGPAVQHALQPRLQAADALAQTEAAPAPAATAHQASTPLAQLLREINALADAPGLGPIDTECHPPADASAVQPFSPAGAEPGLRALRHAGTAWAQLRVQQQLRQSLAKAPGQAGPLNSHALVLRTLQALQMLSPAYLLRFMQQMDTLFALDALQARAVRPAPAGKPPRRTSGTKGAHSPR